MAPLQPDPRGEAGSPEGQSGTDRAVCGGQGHRQQHLGVVWRDFIKEHLFHVKHSLFCFWREKDGAVGEEAVEFHGYKGLLLCFVLMKQEALLAGQG